MALLFLLFPTNPQFVLFLVLVILEQNVLLSIRSVLVVVVVVNDDDVYYLFELLFRHLLLL